MKRTSSECNSLWKQLLETAYSVQKYDLEQAARVMAAAFGSDPSIRYLLGGASEGMHDWRYFLTVLKTVYGKCLMLSSDAAVQDLLVLFPPELKAVPALSFFQHGGFGLCRFFGPKLLLRSLKYENNCQRVKNRFLTPDTWYCMCLVVAPEKQGRGVGSRLIRPVLEILDKQCIPLYLETHKKINTRIYEHLGFSTVDISCIPGTATAQYAMLRQGAAV